MKKIINNYSSLFIIIFISIFLTACSGLFVTDKSLSGKFNRDISDRELSVFYTPNKDNITVALKNVGYSFMTGLTVAFKCVKEDETVTQMYTIGNLKAYFSKNLSVPINFYECRQFSVSYSFLPMPDGGFGMGSDRNFIDPVNPVENTLIIK